MPFLYIRAMPRKKKYIIPLQLVELESNNYHILIEATFPNKIKGKFAIDTGASKTVFDLNQTELFELSKNPLEEIHSSGISESQIETKLGTIPLITISDIEFSDWQVALIDLQHINTLYQQFTSDKLVGLIGSDFLVKYSAIIDYKKLSLIVYH